MGKNQQVQHFVARITASTLATLTALTASLPIDAARVNGVRIKKWMQDVTFAGLASGDGPIIYGISEDLSATEVTEALTADPQGPGDIPATEQGNRKVVAIGMLARGIAGDSGGERLLHDFHWPWPDMQENTGLQFWIFNAGPALLTTGLTVDMWNTVVQEWFD